MAALAHHTAADEATKFVTGGSQLLGPLLAAVSHQDRTLRPPQGDLMLALAQQTRESSWKTTKRSRQQRDAFSLRRNASGASESEDLAFSVSPAANNATKLNSRSSGRSQQTQGPVAASSNLCWNFSLALQSSML